MYFNVLPHVVLCEGKSKCALFDIEEGAYMYIPKDVCRCFEKRTILIDELDVDDKWRYFMLSKGFSIETSFYPHFGSLTEYAFDIPFDYETMVIDGISVSQAIRYINALPDRRVARYTQIRLFCEVNVYDVEKIVQLLYGKSI